MSTDRDVERIVRSWMDEGVTQLPDRVLDLVLDQVPTTPQRRSWWPTWRFNRMNTYLKLLAAAAAVLVVAIVGYQFLQRDGGPGGQPTIAPSPSQALLARGTFTATVGGGYTVDLDATGGASSVTGSMVVSHATNGGFTVDLECTRTIDGLLWIGGDVTQSTYSETPTGTRAAIVLERGSPVKAIFVWQGTDPPSASCQAFFDAMIATGGAGTIRADGMMKSIEGTLELAPWPQSHRQQPGRPAGFRCQLDHPRGDRLGRVHRSLSNRKTDAPAPSGPARCCAELKIEVRPGGCPHTVCNASV